MIHRVKSTAYLLIIAFTIGSCTSKIKDSETKIEIEKETEINEENSIVENSTIKRNENEADALGFWVGYFEEDTKDHFNEKGVYVDEGYYWSRENKINISINKITDSIVIGHSVVAGNNRPFIGVLKNGIFKVKEPGDNKYDGEFIFEISENKLIGKWTAYKNIDIKKRKYELEKKEFSYNPDIMLEAVKKYVDWNKFTKENITEEYEEDEFDEWISKEFATATDLIYTLNASNVLLKKEDVENLKKGDLTILRNTIYARHGYSFKNRPLRVFFDAQSWYIPVHTNIKSDFTEIEKSNIKLLLRYEKNAVEYYDYFGRG
jgi:hypothetical protein